MEYLWLNKNEKNKNLILFLNGWAMNETPVQHLKCDEYDVLCLFDYRNLDFSFPDFSKYEKKILVAWSMGVYVASIFKDKFIDFDRKIAINGTTRIIDNEFGIPKRVYEITVRLLNEDSCELFINNMFDNGKLNPNVKITRQLSELKEELIYIQNIKLKEELEFDKAIISNNDKIVPTKNQKRFWENRAEIEYINSTHCPFEIYSGWQEIIC